MVEINDFICALKVSWIKRFFLSRKKWQKPLEDLQNRYPLLWQVGVQYIEYIHIDNPFWRNVLYAWKRYSSKVNIKTLQDIVNEPLWFNTNFSNSNLCILQWARCNILSINNIINEEGNLFSFNEFKQKFNVRGTVLDYERLIRNIPEEWRSEIKNKTTNTCTYNTMCTKSISSVLKKQQGCRPFYNV